MGSDTKRSARRRLAMVLGGALLLLGATTPSSCQPPAKAMSTLYGDVTQGSHDAGVADPTCPLADGHLGPDRGVRQKWGARIGAADPKEWLSIRPCTVWSGMVTDTFTTGPFTIYTASGDVTTAP